MTLIRGFDDISAAKRHGLKIGDDIVKINGRPFSDIFDYVYADGDDRVAFEFVRRGRSKTVSFQKGVDEPLGIDFGDSLEIKPIRCKNKCVFCFIDQLPKGLRDTLYIKDDDYRLSVICGNYITLTNLSDSEFRRIIDMRISPLYISVHAADGRVRRGMMTNPSADKIMSQIRELTDNGILLHTQIVLCEGLNDGEVLQNTVKKLYSYYPKIMSLAVVPVGLTGHREGLYPLKPLGDKCLNDTIDFIEDFNKGRNWCWCSDEFYIKTGREIPSYDSYGDFVQIENGVGLVADFNKNFADSLTGLTKGGIDGKGQKVAMITGESFVDNLQKCVQTAQKYIKNIQIDVFAVKNKFFGGSVTVSGLVVGRDICAQVPTGYDKYVIPHTMLREFNNVFLDDMSTEEVLKNLCGKSLEVCYENGGDLIDVIAR